MELHERLALSNIKLSNGVASWHIYIYISCHLQNMELQITDPLSGWLMVDIRKLSTSIIHRPLTWFLFGLNLVNQILDVLENINTMMTWYSSPMIMFESRHNMNCTIYLSVYFPYNYGRSYGFSNLITQHV